MESDDRGPDRLDAEERPVFWKELYGFGLITLGGLMLAVLVLAPKLARSRSTADLERELSDTVGRLEDLAEQYEAALAAMEDGGDPFYRDEVIRAVLKVKRRNEEFLLKNGAGMTDN
ncbi:MAG: hypothetical protein HY721_09010 [Planctomycetes bacterium]|nr:hypothetical protein [Planctomycetota bacterium]